MTKQHKDIPPLNERMVDDLEQSAELRSLLRAGIDDDVASYDFQAGLATHIAAVAALPPAASAPHAPPAAAAGISGKALLAWIGAPLASASVIAALWLTSSTEPAREAPRAAHPTTAITAPVPAPVTVAPIAPAQAVATATPAVEPVAAPAAVTSARSERVARMQRSAPAVPSTIANEDVVAVATHDDSEIAAATTVAPDSNVADAQPVEQAPSAAEREALARKAAEQAEQERLAREEARRVAEARLKREMAQLMQATQALNSNPARALSLAQSGEQEFRNSLFSEERQQVLLLALIKLGRVDEAQRLSVPYLRAHPDSPFARRVRNALDAAK